MSGTLPQTGCEKEKIHLSVQGRQDQVHPSEEPSVTSLPVPHPGNPDECLTAVDSTSAIVREIVLLNGEANVGSWRERGTDGTWTYVWSDGLKFEGEFHKGMESGKGKFIWPTGATYQGSFLNGCLHGMGTYTGVDGSTYAGNWIMNLKHGFGEQRNSNGDEYKGTWYQGKREGCGIYTWSNGNLYTGNWKGNVMCGKGKLTWSNGDSFDGHWSDGKEHGHGIYTWVDSGCYVGTWSRGLKDGKGTFYPPGTVPPSYFGLLHGFSVGSDWSEASGSHMHSFGLWCTSPSDITKIAAHLRRPIQLTASGGSTKFLRKAESLPTKTVTLERKWSLEGALEKLLGLDTSFIAGETILEDDEMQLEKAVILPIVEREYAQGVLINEIVKEPLLSKGARRQQRWQVKEIKKPGETILKGHRSYDLMLDLQLGIRTLREMFKIDAADYMMSICGNNTLRELSSPGKSGSIFFLSHDDRFLIKTLRRQELKVLLKMLPDYYNHVCKYENTLITKFFGLHRIKLVGGHKVRFVVMGNVFCTELRIHRRFDLKGSSLGRSADKIEIDETTTLKDLDLDFTFHLEPSWCDSLLKQMKEDCSFLECQQIMDYSLLLGVHFRAPQYTKLNSKNELLEEGVTSTIDNGTYPEGLVLVAHEPNDSAHGSHIRGSSLRAAVAGDEPVDLLAGTARLQIQLGVNMPARADRRPIMADKDATLEDEFFGDTYDVVLCLGIIDILQQYNMAKKLEHAFKALQFDSVSISAVDPQLYSTRFQEFLRKAFPENVS